MTNQTFNANSQTFKRLLVSSDLRHPVDDKDLGNFGLTKFNHNGNIYYIFDGTFTMFAAIANIR